MAGPPHDQARDAHYHAIKTTAKWAALVAAMRDQAKDSATKRARRDAQRERETTYARGELGKH